MSGGADEVKQDLGHPGTTGRGALVVTLMVATVVVTLVAVLAGAAGSEGRFVIIAGAIGLATAVAAAAATRSRWVALPIVCALLNLWAILSYVV